MDNLKHAKYLRINSGDCAYYGKKCGKCFVKPLLKTDLCIRTEAFNLACKHIEDSSYGDVKCHSILED